MKQIKLLLAPQPGAKPEYLDDVVLVDASPAVLQLWTTVLPSDPIVLENYTRDSWAWKPSGDYWTTLTVKSVTGRKKLTGFCDYLKQRQKSCYGRFAPKGIFVVSYTQSNKHGGGEHMDCRIAMDMTQIPKCSLKPLGGPAAEKTAAAKPSALVPPAGPAAGKKGKGGGLLGKLVGAQQRTNHHVAVASVKRKVAPAAMTTGEDGGAAASTAGAMATGAAVESRTAQQVLAEFRQSMQDKMLDFDLSDEQVLKIKLTLSEHTAGLSTEDKTRVTLDILKYIVYEAAEEVNEEWVASKEPSEFMDEVIVAVYKEGAAPEEILEELNKGELPDEIRGQQRAIQEQLARQVNQAEHRNKKDVERDAHRWGGDDDVDDNFAALNQKKRDRRTVEDYEREKNKRSR